MTFNTVTMQPLSYMGLPPIDPPPSPHLANCTTIIEANYKLRMAEAVRCSARLICNKQSLFLSCVSSKREKTVNSRAYWSANKTSYAELVTFKGAFPWLPSIFHGFSHPCPLISSPLGWICWPAVNVSEKQNKKNLFCDYLCSIINFCSWHWTIVKALTCSGSTTEWHVSAVMDTLLMEEKRH